MIDELLEEFVRLVTTRLVRERHVVVAHGEARETLQKPVVGKCEKKGMDGSTVHWKGTHPKKNQNETETNDRGLELDCCREGSAGLQQTDGE